MAKVTQPASGRAGIRIAAHRPWKHPNSTPLGKETKSHTLKLTLTKLLSGNGSPKNQQNGVSRAGEVSPLWVLHSGQQCLDQNRRSSLYRGVSLCVSAATPPTTRSAPRGQELGTESCLSLSREVLRKQQVGDRYILLKMRWRSREKKGKDGKNYVSFKIQQWIPWARVDSDCDVECSSG